MDCELIKQTNPDYMTSGGRHIKCLGIEDFWGNIFEYIDGIATDGNYNIMTTTTNFNDNRSGYKNLGQGPTTSGYMKTVQGTTEKGFIMKSGVGSETTYFSDFNGIGTSAVLYFGGSYQHGDNSGVFTHFLSHFVNRADSLTGSRLMYL